MALEQEKAKNRLEVFRQTNQAAVDFSIKTIWSLFLINGAAATALLSARMTEFYSSAIWFAMGALFSVFAFGISYIYTLLLAKTWHPDYGERHPDEKIFLFKFCFVEKLLSDSDIERARLFAVIPVLISVILFICGIIACICALAGLNAN